MQEDGGVEGEHERRVDGEGEGYPDATHAGGFGEGGEYHV
eukprot:CAMPEP_0196230174 /NCGR_PEP_ID=MMETSP0913-20130531/1473_1 /TAXON_ID=49265 /ORGANISM="Thalassiosira rotula, Strain GSO102" /LENGTH=39 /DNA_ID= /DNA_START= /DNA_END= /DNA_ORIENTATION=